jgi:hypothetical protein
MGRSGSALNSNGSTAGSDGGNGTRGDGVAGTAAATGGNEAIDDAGVNVWAVMGTGAGVTGGGVTGGVVTGEVITGVVMTGGVMTGVVMTGVVMTGVVITGVGTGGGVTGVNAADGTAAGVTLAVVCHLTDEGVSSAATNPGVGAMGSMSLSFARVDETSVQLDEAGASGTTGASTSSARLENEVSNAGDEIAAAVSWWRLVE